MESAGIDEFADGVNPQAECEVVVVGEKRPVDNGKSEELGARSTKKVNCVAGEMRRVAEIVLVLSTMAGMRGGKNPIEAEVNLMAEARTQLVEICHDLAPKDLVGRNAIGAVIEDLGLNWKIKDQQLGFRGARLSIKERVSLTKRKIEGSKNFGASSAPYSSQMSHPSFVAMGDTHGPSHCIRMFSSDEPSDTILPATLGHASAAASTSVANQLLLTEASAPTVSAGLPNSHKERNSSALAGPKVEKSHFKSEGPNGTAYAPQVQANASANQPPLNASTWSLQSHSMYSSKATPENKVLNYNSAKTEGNTDFGLSWAASQAASDQASRPFITPVNLPSVHQPMQLMKYVQPPSFFNKHNEIAKIVQELLQPKFPENTTWAPPSREYMNKSLTCSMCKVTVNEVETVILCDACEKGFHLKCLEAVNQKGIPRGGEWHCLMCTALSNGKPLPPKYGRVMRNIITPPKGASSKKKIVDPKVNQEKSIANGISAIQSSAGLGPNVGNHAEPASDSNAPNARDMTGNSFTACVKDVDQAIYAGNFPNNSTKSLGVVSDSASVGLSSERSIPQAQASESDMQEEESVSESRLQAPDTLSETISKIENCIPSKTSEVALKTGIIISMASNGVSNDKLEKLLCMKGGKGESSYANNSQAQASHARSMLPLLQQTLDKVQLNSANIPFQVAELGCSSGYNTIYIIEFMIKHMIMRYKSSGLDPPEFSAFFSDLPSNDFNTLFQLLPTMASNYEGSMEECLAANGPRNYFAAAVPGSFHKRLFPARSIDVFHSAFSLHWLSQVPESVVDPRSGAYNKERVFIHGASESTANAYKHQFQTDLARFLTARSQEMKRGGSMFLAFLGRTSVDPTDQGGAGLLFGTHYQDAWDDLVKEGLITSEKRDSFNVPVYASSLQEFKDVVEAHGSFVINKLEVFKGGSPLVVDSPDDAFEIGLAYANACRSVSGVLVDAHIGNQLSEELFLRVERRARSHAKELLEKLQFFHIVASLSFV